MGSGWALEKEPHAIDNSFTEGLGFQPVDHFDPKYFLNPNRRLFAIMLVGNLRAH